MTPKPPNTKTVAVGIHPKGNARSEIDALYTPLDEAVVLLQQRRSDEKLRTIVTDFHRAFPPKFLQAKPHAFLSRFIITPNREFELFISTANATDLQPLCLECFGAFTALNADKYRLCRPMFEVRPNHFRPSRIMDFGLMEGKNMSDLKIANGTPLSAFHHALLQYALPGAVLHLHDFSKWFSAARREHYYYLHYLALFIRDGILFENFLVDDPEELRFARERVLPSFARAVELFGVKPLIVPLLPREMECDERWRSHRGDLYDFTKRLLNKSNNFPKLEIRETKKYGKGVFAEEEIKKGRTVAVLDGTRMDVLDLVERVNSDAENINDPLQVGKRTYIDLDDVSRTFNHSCNPSTGIRKTSEIFALRDIKKGEEITYDYSSTIAPTEWKMKCKCGSKNCRNILGDVLSVPTKPLEHYKKVGALQKYMRFLLKEVESGKYEVPKYELLALEKLKKTSDEI